MLLANKTMLSFLKYPFHRNDLANTDRVSIFFYTGPAITPAEMNYINGTAKNATTGIINLDLVNTNLVSTRTRLGSVVTTAGAITAMTSFTQKRHEGPSGAAFLFSQRTDFMQGLAAGDVGLMVIALHGSATTSARTLFCCTVGLPASTEDIKVGSLAVTVGKKYSIADFRVNISNLLG
jgi:hypothetical protein